MLCPVVSTFAWVCPPSTSNVSNLDFCFFNFRFYFVGDEDLLEIIGNSKNVAKLQKHFKKMFAGVSSIILNEDNSAVLGISSREGEEVACYPAILPLCPLQPCPPAALPPGKAALTPQRV